MSCTLIPFIDTMIHTYQMLHVDTHTINFQVSTHSAKGYTLKLTCHWSTKGMELGRSLKRISVLTREREQIGKMLTITEIQTHEKAQQNLQNVCSKYAHFALLAFLKRGEGERGPVLGNQKDSFRLS